MSSIFYKAEFERAFPLPLLFIERLHTRLAGIEKEKDLTDGRLHKLVADTLKECELADSPSKDDISNVLKRLNEAVEVPEADGPKGPKPQKDSFASSYIAWASALQPEEVCLMAARYDYFLAARLYREIDKEDVMELANQYMAREWEKIKVGYESVVYGFGGSYGDGDTNTYDLTEDNPAGMAALKRIL